jgi:hypothetical protein
MSDQENSEAGAGLVRCYRCRVDLYEDEYQCGECSCCESCCGCEPEQEEPSDE